MTHPKIRKTFLMATFAAIAGHYSRALPLASSLQEDIPEDPVSRTLVVPALVGSQLQIVANQTAWDLANIIQGDGLTITNADLQCQDERQAGLFDTADFLLGMERGAVIASAFVTNALGRNDETYPGGSDALGGPGYAPLDKLLQSKNPSSGSLDACVLVLKFKCDDPYRFEFRYIFGSDDYPSPAGNEESNDLMAAFVNGVQASDNIARTDDGDFVSVNTIYDGDGFKDNSRGTYQTEMNGFTVPRTASGKVGYGVNEIRIAVADGGLRKTNTYGAWVFIEAASMKCPATPQPTPRPSPRPTRQPTTPKPHPPPTPRPHAPPSRKPIARAKTPKECAQLVSDTCYCGELKCLRRQTIRRCGSQSITFSAYFKSVKAAFKRLYC